MTRGGPTAMISLAIIASIAERVAGDATCPTNPEPRGCNAPTMFSKMRKSSTLPTVVASAGITRDFKDKLNEGHRVLIDFAGGASPTTAYILEGGGADAAYTEFRTENCEQTTFNGHCGADALITQAKNFESSYMKGNGGVECVCGHKRETSSGLYYILDSSATARSVGERAVHEMCHVTQTSRGEYMPAWLMEGGAVHTECLLMKKLSWSTQTYEDCFRSGGGRGGIIPNFRSYYASSYGSANGLQKGESRECGDFVGDSDTTATIEAGASDNAGHLYYDAGAVAVAWAINKGGITSKQFWQSNVLGEGFWNTIVPWDGHNYATGYPGQCPEDKGWKASLKNITGHATMAAFYTEFDAWARTASVADVVAILESQSAIDTQTAGVFDLSTATEGTDHDPCAATNNDAVSSARAATTTTAIALALAACTLA